MSLLYVFFKGKSLPSWIIERLTRSEFSHVAYLTENKWNAYGLIKNVTRTPVLIECWLEHGESLADTGVHWGYVSPPFKNHKPGTEIEVWELDVEFINRELSEMAIEKEKYIDQAMRKLADSQAPYDWKAILGFLYKTWRDKPGGYICSEGCIAPLVEAFGWDTINPAHIDPETMRRILQAAGAQRIYEGPIEGWGK